MHDELEVDLVIIGFGAAGAAAALAAESAGAEVVICEKQSADRHTPSTRMSGGIIMTANDPALAACYLDRCAGGMVPKDVSEAWAVAAAELAEWLASQDVNISLQRCGGAEHPEFDGAEAIDTIQPGGSTARLDPSGGAGLALWDALLQAVEKRKGVIVRWSSPVRKLITDDGRVIGVETDRARIIARKGVILSCGGFEFDEEIKRDHLRTDPVRFYGNPGNTGDGVRMAQAVGASMWHMNQMIGRAIGSFPMDDGTMQGFIIGIDPPGYVITDRYGRRFANEEPQARLLHGFYYELLHFDSKEGEYPRNPCYWFFDERRRLAGPLSYPHLGAGAVGLHRWSPDNLAEIERGWISRGDTIEAVAAAAGVADPEQAAAEVRAYNVACERGEDPLGRPPASLVPIDTPPFYCVPLWAGGSNTSGGPRRDAKGRILDAFGSPIAGLFGAGELGQVMGLMYPADGSNISDALCFGRIAAETAVING